MTKPEKRQWRGLLTVCELELEKLKEAAESQIADDVDERTYRYAIGYYAGYAKCLQRLKEYMK